MDFQGRFGCRVDVRIDDDSRRVFADAAKRCGKLAVVSIEDSQRVTGAQPENPAEIPGLLVVEMDRCSG